MPAYEAEFPTPPPGSYFPPQGNSLIPGPGTPPVIMAAPALDFSSLSTAIGYETNSQYMGII